VPNFAKAGRQEGHRRPWKVDSTELSGWKGTKKKKDSAELGMGKKNVAENHVPELFVEAMGVEKGSHYC